MSRTFASMFAAGAISVLALGAAAPASAVPITYFAELSGAAEASPNNSPATGNTVVVFDADADTLRVIVNFTGLLSTVTAAHIHCCTAIPGAGTAGVATVTPTFTGFPSGVTSGSYDQTFDLTNALLSFNPAFVTANGGSAATAEAALGAGLAAGKAYLNIHTQLPNGFPSGEIRGFLEVPEPASLALFGLGFAGLAALRRRKPD